MFSKNNPMKNLNKPWCSAKYLNHLFSCCYQSYQAVHSFLVASCKVVISTTERSFQVITFGPWCSTASTAQDYCDMRKLLYIWISIQFIISASILPRRQFPQKKKSKWQDVFSAFYLFKSKMFHEGIIFDASFREK